VAAVTIVYGDSVPFVLKNVKKGFGRNGRKKWTKLATIKATSYSLKALLRWGSMKRIGLVKIAVTAITSSSSEATHPHIRQGG
jgi:hypothetical protein